MKLVALKIAVLAVAALLCKASEDVEEVEWDLGFSVEAYPEDLEYMVEAYPCNPSTYEVNYTAPEGELLTICLEIEESATWEGVSIEEVEEFTFFKEKNNGGVSQVAIEHGVAAEGTTYDCASGFSICAFQSNLTEKFFKTTGDIIGEGTVKLKSLSPNIEDEEEGIQRRASEVQDEGVPAAKDFQDVARELQDEILQERAARELKTSDTGIRIPIDEAEESDRPPVRNTTATAGGMSPTIAWTILMDLSFLGAWLILGS